MTLTFDFTRRDVKFLNTIPDEGTFQPLNMNPSFSKAQNFLILYYYYYVLAALRANARGCS